MLTVETPSRNNPPIPYIIMSSRTHCRPYRGRTMLSRWWLPVGEHLRSCMSDCGVCRFMLYGFLYCFLPPARPVYLRPYPPISPPVSVDISVLTPRYLRPSSFAFPLFLLSFWSLSPLFYLSSNLSPIPVQLLFRIVRREFFFLHSTPSVHFLTAASPLFLFYFRQFPAQSAPVMSIKRIKSLHLNDLS